MGVHAFFTASMLDHYEGTTSEKGIIVLDISRRDQDLSLDFSLAFAPSSCCK